MEKAVRYLILSITMGIGGYVPVLFGASAFDGWSILGTLVGGVAGVWLIVKLNNYY